MTDECGGCQEPAKPDKPLSFEELVRKADGLRYGMSEFEAVLPYVARLLAEYGELEPQEADGILKETFKPLLRGRQPNYDFAVLCAREQLYKQALTMKAEPSVALKLADVLVGKLQQIPIFIHSFRAGDILENLLEFEPTREVFSTLAPFKEGETGYEAWAYLLEGELFQALGDIVGKSLKECLEHCGMRRPAFHRKVAKLYGAAANAYSKSIDFTPSREAYLNHGFASFYVANHVIFANGTRSVPKKAFEALAEAIQYLKEAQTMPRLEPAGPNQYRDIESIEVFETIGKAHAFREELPDAIAAYMGAQRVYQKLGFSCHSLQENIDQLRQRMMRP